MPRPRKVLPANPPLPADSDVAPNTVQSEMPFAERADALDNAKKIKPRFSFAITEKGEVDFGSMREETRAQFEQVIRNTPRVHTLINPAAAEGGLVTAPHIESLLETFCFAEKIVAPIILAKKGFKIDKEIAEQAFTFSPETMAKLSPIGAKLANKHLPEKVKQWIAGGSESAMFFGGLYFAINAQMETAVALSIVRYGVPAALAGKITPSEQPNGEAKIGSTMSNVEAIGASA